MKKVELDESHDLSRVRITLTQSEAQKLGVGIELLNSGQAEYEFVSETEDKIVILHFFRLTHPEELKRIKKENGLWAILLFALVILGVLAIFRLIHYLIHG